MKRKLQPLVPFLGIAGLVVALMLLPVLSRRCSGSAPSAPSPIPPPATVVVYLGIAQSPLPTPAVESKVSTPTSPPEPTVETKVSTPTSPPEPTVEIKVSPHISPLEPTAAVAPERWYTYRVVQSFPHDAEAFTQGLIYVDGLLYEGTGLNGRSSLRRVELESGAVLHSIPLDAEFFGEGLAVLGSRLYQLTWKAGAGFIYDWPSLERAGGWAYEGEGWGLTHDGTHLIMSDGTPTLRFLDPATLQVVRRVEVRAVDGPVSRLNELEYVRGQVYANIWQTNHIARIDPESGAVLGWIDLSGLLTEAERSQGVDVLNGIAYDAGSDRLFVTGKLWPKLFEIDLEPK